MNFYSQEPKCSDSFNTPNIIADKNVKCDSALECTVIKSGEPVSTSFGYCCKKQINTNMLQNQNHKELLSSSEDVL